MTKTTIEWTDETHNPGIFGCSHHGKGCTHCYAERMASRLGRMGQARYGEATEGWRWTGDVSVVPVEQAVQSILDLPRRRSDRPTRTFVTSMGDMLHEQIPVEWTAQVIAAMGQRPDRIFQVLTHRGRRWPEVAKAVSDRIDVWSHRPGGWAWPDNVWAGLSVSTQAEADREIPGLLQVPARVRFLSVEPMLGAVDLTRYLSCGRDIDDPRPPIDGIDWVICGGESGPDARPMHPDWARGLRDQCQAAKVPFLFKQWGEWVTEGQAPDDITLPSMSRVEWATQDADGQYTEGDQTEVYKVGKKAAGRLLDGRTWDEMPEAPRA